MNSRYGDKYPQNSYAHELDEEAEYNRLVEEREMMLLERHENFERELLKSKLDVLVMLSNSINNMADAIRNSNNYN